MLGILTFGSNLETKKPDEPPLFTDLTPSVSFLYNIHMQNDTDTRKLTCQVNVRMTTELRDLLEARAREQWTSASQIARLALAKELTKDDNKKESSSNGR